MDITTTTHGGEEKGAGRGNVKIRADTPEQELKMIKTDVHVK